MKKFLVYLFTILVAVAIAFTVYFLVRDKEVIALSSTRVYAEVGVPFELDVIYTNKKAFSDFEVTSTDPTIASYNKETRMVTPGRGGIAILTFKTTNVKYRNLICEVHVGDGGKNNPFYISTPEQLELIGAKTGVDEEGNDVYRYGLDKCYKLVADIDLKNGSNGSGLWLPIGYQFEGDNAFEGFSGRFNGDGHTISNVNINLNGYNEEMIAKGETDNSVLFKNAGFFTKIASDGMVYNVKFENINIKQNLNENNYTNLTTDTFKKYENVGAVAGVNYGTIERVEVKQKDERNAIFDIQTDIVKKDGSVVASVEKINIGGIVGKNESTEDLVSENNYTRKLARIDRCSVMGNFGSEIILNEETAKEEVVKKYINNANIGGVVGYNYGGRVVYSYAQGEINAYKNSNVGGIAGYNSYFDCPKTNGIGNQTLYKYKYLGGHIQETYAALTISFPNDDQTTGGSAGAIIGLLVDYVEKYGDVETVSTIIAGNYYDSTLLSNVKGVGTYNEYSNNGPQLNKDFNDDVIDDSGARTGYRVMGYPTETLKTKRNVYVLRVSDVDGVPTTVNWNFEAAWIFSSGDYPKLSYMEVEISDNIEMPSETISTLDELKNIKLDGSYVINQDIDMEGVSWTPIGTFENPFIGSLTAAKKQGTNEYCKIKNLTIDSSENVQYLGLFGVIANPAVIKNLTIENSAFNNGLVAGAITAFNGFDPTVAPVQNSVSGGIISNCSALGVTVIAKEIAGGIAGVNMGSIQDCVTSLIKNGEEEITSSVIINALETDIINNVKNSVGGIAGVNAANISTSAVSGKTFIQIKTVEGTTYTSKPIAYAGGIVGNNLSKSQSSVEISISHCIATDFDIQSDAKILARLGGIAGVTNAPIAYCNASPSSILSSDPDFNGVNVSTATFERDKFSFAGGITALIQNTGRVLYSSVSGGDISAPLVGGIAGIVSYNDLKPEAQFTRIKDSKNKVIEVDALYNTIQESAVTNGVSLTGKFVSGLVCDIENGTIVNSYTQAKLNAKDESSYCSGLVAMLNLTTDSIGYMENVYSDCSFNKVGKNYSSTIDEILKSSAIGDNSFIPLQNCGVAKNFYFNKTKADDANAKHQNKGTFGNNDIWQIGGVVGGLDSSKMNSLSSFGGFDSNIWSATGSGSPVLKILNNIGTVNNTIKIEFSAGDINETLLPNLSIAYKEGNSSSIYVGESTSFKIMYKNAEGALVDITSVEGANVVVTSSFGSYTADEQGYYNIDRAVSDIRIIVTISA